jgi:hypothetical protein
MDSLPSFVGARPEKGRFRGYAKLSTKIFLKAAIPSSSFRRVVEITP